MNKCFNNVELINVFNRRFTFDYFITLTMNSLTLFVIPDQKRNELVGQIWPGGRWLPIPSLNTKK